VEAVKGGLGHMWNACNNKLYALTCIVANPSTVFDKKRKFDTRSSDSLPLF